MGSAPNVNSLLVSIKVRTIVESSSDGSSSLPMQIRLKLVNEILIRLFVHDKKMEKNVEKQCQTETQSHPSEKQPNKDGNRPSFWPQVLCMYFKCLLGCFITR
jgi:hypothetical protein